MKQPEIFVFVLSLLFSIQATGQVKRDSARLLKAVVVRQSRLNDYVAARYELPLDSSTLAFGSNGTVAELLRKHGFGHIRSYGPGGLASPSFRGTGSSHTAVLWNGINLISPLSGVLDLSLLPAGLFDDASIQTGGSTSLSGNGSIGANIHLSNNVNFNEGLRAGASSHIGSFGHYYHDGSLRISNKRFGSATKFFRNASENDFSFINRNVFPAQQQKRAHSGFLQYGALQQLHWQGMKAGIISLKLWYQKSRYEIPAATTILRASQATEDNEFYRALAGWNYSKGNLELNYQGAFIRQDLEYSDPRVNQRSSNTYNSTIHNIEGNINFDNARHLTSGIHYTWEEGEADDFGNDTPVRNRVAFFSAFRFDSFQKWKFAFSMREEFVNGKATPLTPMISAKYVISNAIEVFTNLSRNYRLPTFNDLYWKGSGAQGNPALKPEVSLGGEAGLNFANAFATFKTALFSNHVDNWILWSPERSQTWMPHNIKKVWSRGVEAQLLFNRNLNNVNCSLTAQYTFTMSTNQSIYENGNQNEKGKQLVLTPRQEASLTAEAGWKKYVLRIVNSYTGQQFNDSDNSSYNILRPYLITNLWLSKQISRNSFGLTVTAEINNLFNIEYQARPGYPLAGINYKAGIQINFNKPSRT